MIPRGQGGLSEPSSRTSPGRVAIDALGPAFDGNSEPKEFWIWLFVAFAQRRLAVESAPGVALTGDCWVELCRRSLTRTFAKLQRIQPQLGLGDRQPLGTPPFDQPKPSTVNSLPQ